MKTLEWVGGLQGDLHMIDQTLLPARTVIHECNTVEEVWEAIKHLRVRGAPAIGIAAAYGMVIGVRNATKNGYMEKLMTVGDYLKSARPTAVNLEWAVDRIIRLATTLDGTPDQMTTILLTEANKIREEDKKVCRLIGEHGWRLIPDKGGVLTHCNAGALATADYGTALAVMYTAKENGVKFKVFADETRPLLQGARLTCWELMHNGIDVTLITESAAAVVMEEGLVKLVIVGADRIAANGDVANKIGTYTLALVADVYSIPFYVAAPASTFDLSITSGRSIPIEYRSPREVTHPMGIPIAPDGVHALNPAFDVTPAKLITGIITEYGIIKPVNKKTIADMLSDRRK